MKKILFVMLVSFMVLGLMSCGTEVYDGNPIPMNLQGLFRASAQGYDLIIAGNQVTVIDTTNNALRGNVAYRASFGGATQPTGDVTATNLLPGASNLSAANFNKLLDGTLADVQAGVNRTRIPCRITLYWFAAPYDKIATIDFVYNADNGQIIVSKSAKVFQYQDVFVPPVPQLGFNPTDIPVKQNL